MICFGLFLKIVVKVWGEVKLDIGFKKLLI